MGDVVNIKNMFAFGLIGYISGKSKKNVMAKLAFFLSNKSMGGNNRLPFNESGHFIIEELGESSGIQGADLSKNDPLQYIGQAIVVQGGSCSPR